MPQLISLSQNPAPKPPIVTTCPHCNCTLSYMEDEVERVNNEGVGVLCPNCEEPIVTKRIKPFTFPDTFYYCGESAGVVSLTDEEIQSKVDAIEHKLQEDLKVGEFTFTATGNTIIFGLKFEDEDEIIVAKNYWEDSVFH